MQLIRNRYCQLNTMAFSWDHDSNEVESTLLDDASTQVTVVLVKRSLRGVFDEKYTKNSMIHN